MSQAEFDVFLSHNSADKPEVIKLASKLKDMGFRPWLDAWHLIAGEPWLPAISRALQDCGACAVIVGPHGLGNVHEDEMWVALQQSLESKRGDRRFRVIPILLPNATRGDRARLPTFLTANTWVEFRHSIEDPVALERLAKAIRGKAPGTGITWAGGECPYRGLAFFDVQHAPLFFGREAQTDWLLSRLRGTASKEGETRFLAIIGASGSGKSSLARAGVLANLQQGELPGSQRWPLVICRPESRPLESLATALATTGGVNLGTGLKATLIRQLAEELLKSPDELHLVAQGALPANDPEWRLVVLVDQFEELFTLNQADPRDAQAASSTPALSSDRVAFLQNLLRAATIGNGRTIVILTMRADFYGKCAAFPELAMAVSQHQELVGPMSADELRRAVETPAQLSGSDIEPGLVDLLTHEVADQAGALPLLQYALAELWQKSRELGFSKLTTSVYRELGGWEGALSRRADAVLAEFKNTPQEDLCRQLFLRLVQPGEGTEDTKRLVRWQELERDTPSKAAALEQTVRKLADNRLITTSSDSLNADSTIEVVHETLIRSWPELRRWLDADRAGQRTRQRLTEAAREWFDVPSESKKEFLYSGTRLAEAAEWSERHRDELSPIEAAFLDTSQSTERRLKADKIAFWRNAGMVALAGIVVLVATSVVAVVESFKARRAAEIAQKAEQELKTANQRLETAYQDLKTAYQRLETAYQQLETVMNERDAALTEVTKLKELTKSYFAIYPGTPNVWSEQGTVVGCLGLMIGLDRVNRDSYGGWEGAFYGCEADAETYYQIARNHGFKESNLRVLKTHEATHESVAKSMLRAAELLKPGDMFFLAYAGARGQLPDRNGDEPDGMDATWCLYDRQLRDDELDRLWRAFRPGVRILVISDSSGPVTISRQSHAKDEGGLSLFRSMPPAYVETAYKANKSFYDALGLELHAESQDRIVASVLMLGSCQDGQLAIEQHGHGRFTSVLEGILSGPSVRNYRDLFEQVAAKMPATQKPCLSTFGSANDTFYYKEPPLFCGR